APVELYGAEVGIDARVDRVISPRDILASEARGVDEQIKWVPIYRPEGTEPESPVPVGVSLRHRALVGRVHPYSGALDRRTKGAEDRSRKRSLSGRLTVRGRSGEDDEGGQVEPWRHPTHEMAIRLPIDIHSLVPTAPSGRDRCYGS